MKFSIITDKYGPQSYSDKWSNFLNNRGVQVELINFQDLDLIEKIRSSDGLMWRPSINPDDKQKAKRLIFLIDKYLHIPVFPDWNTYWHYDDKISQSYLFQALGINTPKTWIFWDEQQALKWAESITYPLVHKLSVGASSSYVTYIKSIEEAKKMIKQDFKGNVLSQARTIGFPITRKSIVRIIERLEEAIKYVLWGKYPTLPKHFWQPEKNYSFFQEFVPDNKCDTRVTIIGNRAFAFRRWNRDNDFRASGSGKLDYSTSEINEQCIHKAFEISQKAEFQCMAYDFLLNQGVPVLSEISYTFSDQAVYDCPGYWDKDLNWHEGHVWPEEAQVEDFIHYLNHCKNG